MSGEDAVNQINSEVSNGTASLGEWIFDKPTYIWTAKKMYDVLRESREAFSVRKQQHCTESDEKLKHYVFEHVLDADKASFNNTTQRAFKKLTSSETPEQEIDLIFSFLLLRVKVESGDLSEQDAQRIALEERSKLGN